jgi:serine/threonine protein kinase
MEGRVLGGCKLIRKIGEGGMGQVYLGEQQRVGNRLVAVKIVQPGDASHIPGAMEEVERRFQREAALLGQFSHPNILPVHDSGVEEGLLYLVMQYAPEGSLSDAMKGRAAQSLVLPASLEFTSDIIGQVADALQYTHSRGVVHRDVKPGNILVRIEPSGHWHALLADFGIARAQETTPNQTQVTGTFAYMAPEQFSGKFSPASDQYALAVMAFQLLTGRTPFEGDLATLTRGHMYEQPPSLRALNPDVPEAVEQVINRALAKDPAQRYPSVADFARALGGAVTGKAVPVAAATLASVSVGAVAVAASGGPSGGPSDSPAPNANPPSAGSPSAGSPSAGSPSANPAEAGPKWPLPPRPRRGGSPWRTLVAVLAAGILLIGVIGGSGLVAQHQRQLNAQATQTAQSIGAAHAAATARAQAQATAAAQTAIAATATATFEVPTSTATIPPASDVTTPPAAPSGAGTLLVSDPRPTCDQPSGPTWLTDNATSATCDQAGFPVVAAQSATQSACIELTTQGTGSQAQPLNVKDGYFSAIADAQSGGAILAFRVGNGQTTGSTTNHTAYFFKVDKANKGYALARIGADGQATILKQDALSVALGQHFALGALYQGGSITLYVNGQQIAALSDTTFTQGWVGLCTDGTTQYRDIQVYSAS